MNKVFITGIGTEVGKTMVSSILVEAYGADYWKPVQAGSLEFTDTHSVKNLISNTQTIFHPERFVLKNPLSPHQAAALENQSINLEDFEIPVTKNKLIIEGAGGLMVPFNNKGDTFLDFAKENYLPTVVVLNFYLGSINHSLLTFEVLRHHQINVLGMILNGPVNQASKEIILKKTGIPALGEVPNLPLVNKKSIGNTALQFKKAIPGW